jgi:hypothetical protein
MIKTAEVKDAALEEKQDCLDHHTGDRGREVPRRTGILRPLLR